MLAQRLRDRHEDHAGLLQLFLEGRGDRNRIEHGVDRDAVARREGLAILANFTLFRLLAHNAEQRLALAQRNAELVVGLEDFGIDVVERLRRLEVGRRGIIVGVLIVDRPVVDLGPLRLAHGQPAPIGVEPPFEHPGRLVLLRRNEADGVLVQALRGLLGFDGRLEPILVLVNVDPADLIDGLLYGRHLTPPQRLQGPRGLSVGYDVCCEAAGRPACSGGEASFHTVR